MKKIFLVILVFITLGIITGAAVIIPRWCSFISGVSVLKNNTLVANPKVCRCRQDIIIIAGDNIGLFIVDLNKQTVGYGNENQFNKTPIGWLSLSSPINYVEIGSEKTNVAPHLKIDNKQISFEADVGYSVFLSFQESFR